MTSQDKIFQSKWSMCGRSLENKLQKDMLCSPSLSLSLSLCLKNEKMIQQ